MNPLKKGSEVEVNGTKYKLVFDFAAIAEAEELTGHTLLAGMKQEFLTQPPINRVRDMFFASAKALQPNLTYEKAKLEFIEHMDKAGVPVVALGDIWTKVLEAWFESSIEPETEEAPPENPTQDQS